MSRRSSIENETNPVIDPKLRDFALYNNSLNKLIKKLCFRSSPLTLTKALAITQDKNSLYEKMKLFNNEKKDKNEDQNKSEFDIVVPPKFYNSTKINNIESILSFDKSLYQNVKIPIAGKSVLELFYISESREIHIKIPPTIIITKIGEYKTLTNHSRGWIKAMTLFSIKEVPDFIANNMEEKNNLPNNKSSDEPKFIVKIYNEESFSNETLFYSNRKKLLYDISNFQDKFPLIIVQKFIGSMSIETLNEKRPYIFRCIIFNNKTPCVFLIKKRKKNACTRIEEGLQKKKESLHKKLSSTSIFSTLQASEDFLETTSKNNLKYSVSNTIKEFLFVRKQPNEYFEKLISDCIYIKNLYNKYVCRKNNFVLKSIVIDFIKDKDNADSYSFLQIKNVEAEKINFDKIKYLKNIRMKRGLELEDKKCDGLFCKNEYFPFVEKFEIALIGKQILHSNWNKAGNNLERNEELNIYLQDYNELKSKFKFKNMKSDNADNTDNLNLNVLSPFWNSFENLITKRKLLKRSIMKLHNTCDLCHKILKLYLNKKELEQTPSNHNLLALIKYQNVNPESITIDDFSNVIDLLSFNIPGLEKKETSHNYNYKNKNSFVIRRRSSNSYFYGYNPIIDSVNLISLYEKGIPIAQNPSTRNFLLENRINTMNVSKLPKISNPTPRKKTDRKEKNRIKLLKISNAYKHSDSFLKLKSQQNE